MTRVSCSNPRPPAQENPLYAAIKKGDCEAIQRLSEEPNFDPNAPLDEVLCFSPRKSDPSNPLLSYNSEPSPLHLAITHNQKPVVELLLKLKADPNLLNSWGYPPLCWAIHLEKVSCANALIKHDGTNLELPTNRSKSPITLALEKNSAYLLMKLLKKKVSICGTEELLSKKSEEIQALFRDKIEPKAAL